MIPDGLLAAAEAVVSTCAEARLRLAVAESCTGGMICACLTAVPGASAVLERGFVTYANAAKAEMLGVSDTVLQQHGAVSAETAAAMAAGALAASHADLALAVTGIAGPGGGGPDKPVGLVYLAVARKGGGAPVVERRHFPGHRAGIRLATVARGLELLRDSAIS